MYGRQGKILAKPGHRDALLRLMRETARGGMPGCRIYVLGPVAGEPDAIAITEVWDDKAAHAASLALPAIKKAIADARPLIAGVGEAIEMDTVGGIGLD